MLLVYFCSSSSVHCGGKLTDFLESKSPDIIDMSRPLSDSQIDFLFGRQSNNESHSYLLSFLSHQCHWSAVSSVVERLLACDGDCSRFVFSSLQFFPPFSTRSKITDLFAPILLPFSFQMPCRYSFSAGYENRFLENLWEIVWRDVFRVYYLFNKTFRRVNCHHVLCSSLDIQQSYYITSAPFACNWNLRYIEENSF